MDFHTHTYLSGDGELLPSELLRRAQLKGYAALAMTDHVDASNLERVLAAQLQYLRDAANDFPVVALPGVELTDVPPARIAALARRAKELGAAIVVVHGETIAEEVAPGTNRAAVECADVDMLAHPGLLTMDEARLAAQNKIFLELSARRGHSLTNGHVARSARDAGAQLLVNTDAHAPDDLMDHARAMVVARGAGLDDAEVIAATETNPRELLERARARLYSKA
ncbi:MAG: histidinol phosphate phosphatase domain-containing protein [Chloroflexi bacterium]|nr:histidinol phosphate phosphatase domain-containing protein [Chloroflexota bacterium]